MRISSTAAFGRRRAGMALWAALGALGGCAVERTSAVDWVDSGTADAGGTLSAGGEASTDDVASGGSSGSGSGSSSGTSGSGMGSSGTGDGGSPSSTGDGSAAGDARIPGCPTHACTNPTNTIQLDPSNAQAGITLSGYYVDTDTWNAANYQVSQTLYICDYNNWYVTANMNNSTGDGAVKTYPNVHMDFPAAPKISSYTSITSCFAHTAPHVGIYEFAYDIWLNGVATSGSTEVMIWTDNYFQVPSGSPLETVTFDGQGYQVYRSGNGYIAFVAMSYVTSGTVNLLSFFNHIMSKGWIPATSTIGAIDYGVEIVSTNGNSAKFEVNDFSVTAN
jgi:hypothetical protein